jgi:hypothetical protein
MNIPCSWAKLAFSMALLSLPWACACVQNLQCAQPARVIRYDDTSWSERLRVDPTDKLALYPRPEFQGRAALVPAANHPLRYHLLSSELRLVREQRARTWAA